MLVARGQLDFVKQLFAEFRRSSSDMEPLTAHQAQYIAIVAMLRSIGHVFQKVDCNDDPERKAWAKSAWPKWKQELIFRDFIEPARNQLLKEFSGGLTLRNTGFSSPALVARGLNITTVVAVDPDQLEDSEGRKVIELINKAIEFWERVLPKTETDWGAP